eukprot:scaffold91497_cov37-Prasinocladus_malaysianus.AAC.1
MSSLLCGRQLDSISVLVRNRFPDCLRCQAGRCHCCIHVRCRPVHPPKVVGGRQSPAGQLSSRRSALKRSHDALVYALKSVLVHHHNLVAELAIINLGEAPGDSVNQGPALYPRKVQWEAARAPCTRSHGGSCHRGQLG